MQPTVFYHWQGLFENGAAAFEHKRPTNHSAEQERIASLERKIQTKDEALTGVWVPHDTRDQVVDLVRRWSERTEICAGRFIEWLDITASNFYD